MSCSPPIPKESVLDLYLRDAKQRAALYGTISLFAQLCEQHSHWRAVPLPLKGRYGEWRATPINDVMQLRLTFSNRRIGTLLLYIKDGGLEHWLWVDSAHDHALSLNTATERYMASHRLVVPPEIFQELTTLLLAACRAYLRHFKIPVVGFARSMFIPRKKYQEAP